MCVLGVCVGGGGIVIKMALCVTAGARGPVPSDQDNAGGLRAVHRGVAALHLPRLLRSVSPHSALTL